MSTFQLTPTEIQKREELVEALDLLAGLIKDANDTVRDALTLAEIKAAVAFLGETNSQPN